MCIIQTIQIWMMQRSKVGIYKLRILEIFKRKGGVVSDAHACCCHCWVSLVNHHKKKDLRRSWWLSSKSNDEMWSQWSFDTGRVVPTQWHALKRSWKIQWISYIKVFWLPAKKVKGVVSTFTYPRMLLRLMTILGDIVNHHWWCHSILVRMGGVEMVRQS